MIQLPQTQQNLQSMCHISILHNYYPYYNLSCYHPENFSFCSIFGLSFFDFIFSLKLTLLESFQTGSVFNLIVFLDQQNLSALDAGRIWLIYVLEFQRVNRFILKIGLQFNFLPLIPYSPISSFMLDSSKFQSVLSLRVFSFLSDSGRMDIDRLLSEKLFFLTIFLQVYDYFLQLSLYPLFMGKASSWAYQNSSYSLRNRWGLFSIC